jgi:hypothetical protein
MKSKAQGSLHDDIKAAILRSNCNNSHSRHVGTLTNIFDSYKNTPVSKDHAMKVRTCVGFKTRRILHNENGDEWQIQVPAGWAGCGDGLDMGGELKTVPTA